MDPDGNPAKPVRDTKGRFTKKEPPNEESPAMKNPFKKKSAPEEGKPAETADVTVAAVAETADVKEGKPAETADVKEGKPAETADVTVAAVAETADVKEGKPAETADVKEGKPAETADVKEGKPAETADVTIRPGQEMVPVWNNGGTNGNAGVAVGQEEPMGVFTGDSTGTDSLCINGTGVTVTETTDVTIRPGQEIRVAFQAEILNTQLSRPYRAGTAEVRENGNGKIHYLYLRSSSSLLSLGCRTPAPRTGDTIRVSCTAVVEANAEAPGGTAMVRTRYDSGITWRHFLDLTSSSITLVPQRKTALASPDDRYLNSIAIIARLAELDANRGTVTIKRIISREGQDKVLATVASTADAEKFLEDGDYDPKRFCIEEALLTEQEETERERLARLQGQVRLIIGQPRWDSGVTLVNESILNESWARNEAQAVLPGSNFSTWPLNQIDWTVAARTHRAALYNRFKYGDAVFCITKTA
jgi:hypothetical protein